MAHSGKPSKYFLDFPRAIVSAIVGYGVIPDLLDELGNDYANGNEALRSGLIIQMADTCEVPRSVLRAAFDWRADRVVPVCDLCGEEAVQFVRIRRKDETWAERWYCIWHRQRDRV